MEDALFRLVEIFHASFLSLQAITDGTTKTTWGRKPNSQQATKFARLEENKRWFQLEGKASDLKQTVRFSASLRIFLLLLSSSLRGFFAVVRS